MTQENDILICCNECGEEMKEDVEEYRFNNTIYCCDCYGEITRVCDNCGETHHRDDTAWCSDCETNSCEDCSCSCSDNENDNFETIRIPFEKVKSKTFKDNKFKNYCGIELEVLNNDLCDSVFNYSECLNNGFSQVEDGSLDSNGVEFVSNAFNGDLLYNKIDKFCKLLKEKEFYVNSECGFHIHIEVNKRCYNLKKLFIFYKKYEDYFFDLFPTSRKNNSFARRNEYDIEIKDILKIKTNTQLKKLLYKTNKYTAIKHYSKDKYNSKRYNWFNLHSVFYRNTLELRIHSGTTNAQKIKNWLKINLTILKFIENLNIETINLLPINKTFFLSLFDDDINDYLKKRWNEHALYNKSIGIDIRNPGVLN